VYGRRENGQRRSPNGTVAPRPVSIISPGKCTESAAVAYEGGAAGTALFPGMRCNPRHRPEETAELGNARAHRTAGAGVAAFDGLEPGRYRGTEAAVQAARFVELADARP
jgi:hypothetical protein